MNSEPLDTEQQLADLQSDDPARRLAAVHALTQHAEPTAEVLRQLERAALSADPELRRAALEALAAPTFRTAHATLAGAGGGARQFMLAEIDKLEADGLLSAQQAAVLHGRYALPAAPASIPQPSPIAPPQRISPSLSQLLLSETSVKIALYLGAFFVVAAAFILAALIEVARLPILTVFTLLFFAAAFGLERRLPAASFVLFAVGGFMLPIVGGVLADRLQLDTQPGKLYWAGVFLLTGAVLTFGTRVYRSRLFSILAFLSLFTGVFILGIYLFTQEFPVMLLLGLTCLGGLAAAGYLGRLGGAKLSWPLFLSVQTTQAVLLLASLGFTLVDVDAAETQWLYSGVLWGLGTLFYVLSDRVVRQQAGSSPFAFPAAACAMIAPLIPLIASDLSSHGFAFAVWLWGALLAGLAEALDRRSTPAIHLFSIALFIAAGLLFPVTAAIESSEGSVALAIVYLLAAAGLFTALSLHGKRWGLWSAALLFAYTAYLTAQEFPAIRRLDPFPGYVLLLPSMILLAMEQTLRRRGASRRWWLPPLVTGVLSSLALGWTTLLAGLEDYGAAAVTFTIFSVFLLGYAGLDRRPWVAYVSLGGLALALIYALAAGEVDEWVAPLIGLAVLYDLIGLALSQLAPRGSAQPEAQSEPRAGELPASAKAPADAQTWASVFQSAGLVMGALVSIAAPLQGGPLVVTLVALVASLYAFEAYRRDWIWLGFPTVMLYFLAYALALGELEIREPQFYSIVAALLGMVMYHLLARRRHHAAALITGLLAQLILLSTTYIQMVRADEFRFFFILFFQALALLVYGLVVRSRSFVVFPIVALVISVATVALTVLSGLPTVLIVGCTGLLLLMLGILALLLRERLTQAADRWVGGLEMP